LFAMFELGQFKVSSPFLISNFLETWKFA